MSSASRAHGTIVADAFKLVEQSDPVPPDRSRRHGARRRDGDRPRAGRKGSDNIGVGGYRVAVDSALRYLGAGRTLSVTGLTCNSVHAVSVRALDMVSNRSPKAPVWVRTAACPPAPAGLTATPQQTAVALPWSAPAAGLRYRVFMNGVRVGRRTTPTRVTVTGLPAQPRAPSW